jgi:hypothetical protein
MLALIQIRGQEHVPLTLPHRKLGAAYGQVYYTWPKEFLEAGKKRLSGDTQRQASTSEVKDLRRESRDLKEVRERLS